MSDETSHAKRRKTGGNGIKGGAEKYEDFPADRFACGYDFLLVNSGMDEPCFGEVLKETNDNKKNSKLVLIVVTLGGLPNPAYRIGRYLQSLYDEVAVFVPSLCKSAGTLLATCGNELLISPFGEIGPLDVQLLQKDEILARRRSGLTTRTAIQDLSTHAFKLFEHFMLQIVIASEGRVSFKLAADIAARVTGDTMSKIYEQINPDCLAEDYRDLSIATQYCRRLNQFACNIDEDGIDRLVNSYPSHDFVIDLEEARSIFRRVDLPSQTLYKIMGENLEVMMQPASGPPVIKMLASDSDGMQHEEPRDCPAEEEDDPRVPASAGGVGEPGRAEPAA